MNHILDNPVWNALISGNKEMAQGNEKARYFSKEISPFVGLVSNSPGNFKLLYDIIPFVNVFGLASPVEITIPLPWKVYQQIKVLQMIFPGSEWLETIDPELVPLQEQHVPEMLTLIKLTNPGPFASRTIDFGNYRGIFIDGKLVAMAGQRLHPFEYVEISAVCTHPDHLGKGYAKRLISNQVNHIRSQAGIPFLQVKSDNKKAIQLYESLGFVTRQEMLIYAIQKSSHSAVTGLH